MEDKFWRSPGGNLWKGVFCALGFGWLVLACINWATFEIYASVSTHALLQEHTTLIAVAATLILIVTLAATSLIAGALCALFWHPFFKREFYCHWSFPIIFALFAPTGFLPGENGTACCLLFFGFPLSLLSQKGFDFGTKWWPQQRGICHFFGLANYYKRDESER